MFRFLPWGSGHGGNEVTAENMKLLAAKQRTSPVIEVPSINKLKRKRADSGDSDVSRNGRSPNKKRIEKAHQVVIPKVNNGMNGDRNLPVVNHPVKPSPKPAPAIPSNDSVRSPVHKQPSEPTMSKIEAEKMQRVIEAEFSLEILLKHDELRLIDLEIAKCQTALEQLRRCQEIPFPATTSNSGSNSSIGLGIGPSVPWTGVGPPPESPAAWGVTDGPYSRHYSRWLLPDPRWDGGEADAGLPMGVLGKMPLEGRATRGSFTESIKGLGGKSSRSHRGNTGTKLQALSSGYPQPKDKAGPLILTRASDGQLVKLVCQHCRRDNFSSAQGFINHCRIAHGQNFPSHEAAAQHCGEPVETDEAGAMVGAQNETSNGQATTLVHPFIRSAHLMGKQAASDAATKPLPPDGPSQPSGSSPTSKTSLPVTPSKRKRGRKRKNTTNPSTFVASSDTPFLSAFMQKKGSSLDLKDVVVDAKTLVELESSSSEEDEGEEQDPVLEDSTAQGGLRIQGTRLPTHASMSPAPLDRPPSRKGLDKANRKPRYLETFAGQPTYTSPYPPPTTIRIDDDIEMLEPSPTNLSPNTIESNQAPSLVSDDDDYEAHSASESPSSSSAENDEGDLDVEVEDDETATTGGSESTSTNDHELASVIKPHPSSVRRASALRGGINRNGRVNKEEKHVSFVSPDVSDAPSPQGRRGPGRRRNKG